MFELRNDSYYILNFFFVSLCFSGKKFRSYVSASEFPLPKYFGIPVRLIDIIGTEILRDNKPWI